jgi:hypothetical protein
MSNALSITAARRLPALRRLAGPLCLLLTGHAHDPFLGAADLPGAPDVVPAPAPQPQYLYPTWAALLAAFAAHPDEEPYFQALAEAGNQENATGAVWGAAEQPSAAPAEAVVAVNQAQSLLRVRLQAFVIQSVAAGRIAPGVVMQHAGTIGAMEWPIPAAAPALPAVEG